MSLGRWEPGTVSQVEVQQWMPNEDEPLLEWMRALGPAEYAAMVLASGRPEVSPVDWWGFLHFEAFQRAPIAATHEEWLAIREQYKNVTPEAVYLAETVGPVQSFVTIPGVTPPPIAPPVVPPPSPLFPPKKGISPWIWVTVGLAAFLLFKKGVL